MEEQTETHIIEYSLDGVMVGVSINLKPELLKRIDEAKGTQSRSGFIVRAVYEYLQPVNDADRKQLLTQLEAHKATQLRLESEVEFLRQQYSLINSALAQKLLTEAPAKRSIWEKLMGRPARSP